MSRSRKARLVATLALLPLALAMSGCGKKTKIPSTFEVIGSTTTDEGTFITLRDKGTGCEMISGPNGMMERNERSADGLSVKQRCVMTGEEQPVPGQTPSAGNGQPSFQAVPNPVGTEAQEQAVRDAIRAQTQGAIPPASAPEEPSIPPPRGNTRTTPVAPNDGDGVESQLKN